MFNSFANVFDAEDNETKKTNGTNPFDLPPAPVDPFGISFSMKLSESSEKFDDNPFSAKPNNDQPVRARSGKEALFSSNWLAYQHSMDEANMDPLDELPDKALDASGGHNNRFNPFDSPTIPDTNPSIEAALNSLPMDFLGFNQANSVTDTSNSAATNPPTLPLPAKESLGLITTPYSVPQNTPQPASSPSAPSSTATLPAESNSKVNSDFQDWFTQSANTTKPTDASASFPHQSAPMRRPSNERLPAIRVQKPSAKKGDQQSEEDSDDEKKMVFRIGEKKPNATTNDALIPLPLLPPPPSPSSAKKYQKGNAEPSSSSSSDSEQDDPLAIFRSKCTKPTSDQQPGRNLITDWDDDGIARNQEQNAESTQVPSSAAVPPLDYYLHEPDYDDSAPLEAYHNDITELQLQQLNGWLLLVRVPLRQKDLYKSTFQRFSETRNWQECYVRIFVDEKKLRFYLPQTIEQPFAEIELQTWYQCTKFSLQQYDQFSKIHTFKIFEANYREIPQVRIDRLVTLPEKLLRRFTRPTKAQQVLLDHANCVQQEIVKFGQLNYAYLKQFSIILDDLFWSMPVARSRLQKHLKEEITVKILDEYFAHVDKYHHICKHKSRTRLFILAFLNGNEPVVEIGMNDWFRHGKEVNKRNEIVINKTLQEYWIKPEQVELASIIDSSEYENTHLLKLIPPDSQKVEIMRFRTRPKQNIELPLLVYCFMSVINRQVNVRIEVTVSNAFNIGILSKASSMATNDKTANVRDDNSDEQCPCEDIQIRFPMPDPWVYMFRVEKRFRYGAIHSVRRTAGKIKGLDRLMVHRNDGTTPFMAASAGVAKYEQAFRSIVWRIDQLPKRDQGAYKTHVLECSFSVPSHDPVPVKYEPTADVEYGMSQAFVSHCQIRSVAVPSADETPEKWIRPKSRFIYLVDIEYAFKEEEKKEFAPVEIDMKEQAVSQSETENNSQSDESD